MKPMLSLPMAEDVDPLMYINNPAWMEQQKLDGERLLGEVNDREVTGYNRRGDLMRVPENIAADFDKKAFTGKWVFDGEILGPTYFVFDCVQAQNAITPETPYSDRFQFLTHLMERWNPVNVRLVPHATKTNKKAFFDTCLNNNVEGVIFKLGAGRYRPGKRTMESLKCKFTTTAEVFITDLNRTGSLGVSTAIIHNGKQVDAGGCKLPAEAFDFVKVGDVIEVRYLYASQDHKLVQPIWIRPRFDKNAEECTTDQLKYTSKEPVQA